MVDADFSGNFTNPLNCRNEDIGIVLNEGAYEEKTNLRGQKYKQLNIGVEVNGKQLIHSPRMAEGQRLVKAWGKDTKAWIGKKFKCKIITAFSLGKETEQVRLEPLIEQKV